MGELPVTAWQRTVPRDLSTPRNTILVGTRFPRRSGRDDSPAGFPLPITVPSTMVRTMAMVLDVSSRTREAGEGPAPAAFLGRQERGADSSPAASSGSE